MTSVAQFDFCSFDSKEACATTLADDVALQLADAVDNEGKASLIVSGGSTPKPFFGALQSKPLDWSCVTVSLADERFVAPDNDDSTEKLVRNHLLNDETSYLSLAPKDAQESLQQAEVRLNKVLQQLAFPLTTVILGMGDDGHTASLFPHHPQLHKGLDRHTQQLCLAVENSPKPPPQRISLTYPALTQCRHLILHITGDDKRHVFDKAVTSGDELAYPIVAFAAQSEVPLTIYWAA